MRNLFLIPSQEVTFLGFLLNSVTMTISLTPEKATHFLEQKDVNASSTS
jgi:hypothetical protein